jgi:hypothetical protein
VVQVDDVDPRDDAIGIREVGLEARDPAVDRRLEVVAGELDRVLAGADVDRPVAVRERLRVRGRGEDEEQDDGEQRTAHEAAQPTRPALWGPPIGLVCAAW